MITRQLTIDLGDLERKEAAVARRFPVSVSSETPVTRRGWDGNWTEILSHAAGAVDLSRAPLPLLESHDRTRVNVGIVSNLRLDGSRLRGELVLGASQRAGELAADIAAGIVTGLSVGYRIDVERRDEKAKRITATRWTPYEVSIVSVPADVTVGINRSLTMDPNDTTQQPPAPAAATREVLAERERVAFITNAASRHRAQGIDAAWAQRLIDAGTPLEAVRVAVLDRLAAYSDALPPRSTHYRADDVPLRLERGQVITPGDDLGADFHRAAIDALLLRSGIGVEKPHAAAGDISVSVLDLARTCLSRAGKSAAGLFGGEVGGKKLIERAMTTSDFPLILTGALHASVRRGYETEPASHRHWVRAQSVPDFRDQERPILGSAPDLEKVSEGGEYRHGALSEDSAKYRVEKYGRIVALTWEILKNDALGAWLRLVPAMGQAARRKEADVVYALLAENAGAGPTMQDGVVLFHTATHGNLTSSAAFDATQLSAGRALLRKQKALGGGWLSLVPSFLIVPSEKETAAEVLLANASRRMTTAKAEPEWISNLQLVVEPRLPSTAVYLAADANQIDHIELGLLDDNINGPMVDEEEEFEVDEKRWKVRHVFGAKALDWRGLVRMPVT